MPSERVSNSKQLQTMGKLSEVVAHDINNLLSGVLGYSELLLEENTADHLKPLIEELMKSGKRIASLVRLLLIFCRSEYNPEQMDPNQLIQDLQKYVHHIIGAKIRFDVSLQPGLWLVRSDPAYIKRILLSIAADAQEMIPEGGQFALETENVSIPDHSAPTVAIDSGRYVRITARASIQIPCPGSPAGPRTILRDSDLPGIVRLCGGHLFDVAQSEQDIAVQIYLPAAD